MAKRTHLEVNRRIRIPLSEFDYRFTRSSGPGGQNVNKLSTKVTLSWRFAESASLPDDVKQRLAEQQKRRISAAGDLTVTSQRYRYQSRNVDDCLEKLRAILQKAAAPPKIRRRTRPTAASKQRTKQAKAERAGRKQLRRKPEWEE
jgi:ribosome-associated protein